MNLIEHINSHKFISLDELVEENDLELVLFIEEARIDEDADEDLKEVLKFTPSAKINPIISDEKCKRCKAAFEDYLIYPATDESFDI